MPSLVCSTFSNMLKIRHTSLFGFSAHLLPGTPDFCCKAMKFSRHEHLVDISQIAQPASALGWGRVDSGSKCNTFVLCNLDVSSLVTILAVCDHGVSLLHHC